MASEQVQNGKQGGAQELNHLEKTLQAYMQKAGDDFANSIQNFNKANQAQNKYVAPIQQTQETADTQKTPTATSQNYADANKATLGDFIKRIQEMDKQFSSVVA